MEKTVLIVHPDVNMIVGIEDVLDKLHKTDGYDFHMMRAKNRAAAEEQVGASPIDLVVTALEIAADDKSPIAAGEQHRFGIELVHSLRTKLPGLRAIVVTGQVDNEVFDFTRSEGVDLALEGRTFPQDLTSAVRRSFGPPQPSQPSRVVLSISLSTGRCTYQFQEEGRMPPTGRELDIDFDRLKLLVSQSSRVHIANDSWPGELQLIGESLADELFQYTPHNIEFRDEFQRQSDNVGRDNIIVRFIVEDDLHPIAVEALKRRRDDRHWMLRHAMYREQQLPEVGRANFRSGLFQDEQTSTGPINVLIIDADVPLNAVVKNELIDVKLPPLPNLEDEVEAVKELLSKLKAAGRPIGEVRAIKPADVPVGGSFKELVEDILNRGKCNWHILHYAGHTHYDTQHQVGYLFFPGSGIRPVEPVTVAEFALWLEKANTRFVFLSSCKSAAHDFIYRLAQARVPSIMGFLWPVDDAKAREYAESFYRHVFDERRQSLEYACLEAKKEMWAKYQLRNPIWASPVLVMQV